MKHFIICHSLLQREENDPFLKRIVTCDEKRFVYKHVARKQSWQQCDEPPQSTSKANIRNKKIMMSVRCDFEGGAHFELLPRNQTINSAVTAIVQIEQCNRSKAARTRAL